MDGHRDIFIACSVGDLYWLKKSLPGREKLIGKLVNQEVSTISIEQYYKCWVSTGLLTSTYIIL